jgi:hypothetical protein
MVLFFFCLTFCRILCYNRREHQGRNRKTRKMQPVVAKLQGASWWRCFQKRAIIVASGSRLVAELER